MVYPSRTRGPPASMIINLVMQLTGASMVMDLLVVQSITLCHGKHHIMNIICISIIHAYDTKFIIRSFTFSFSRNTCPYDGLPDGACECGGTCAPTSPPSLSPTGRGLCSNSGSSTPCYVDEECNCDPPFRRELRGTEKMKQQERTLKKPNKNPSDPPPTTLPPVTSPPQPSPTTQPPTCGCILPETQPPTPNPDCVACSETGSTNGQCCSPLTCTSSGRPSARGCS